MRSSKSVAAVVSAAAVVAGMFLNVGTAAADGSSHGSVCGGVGTFKTVDGVAQVQYIVDSDGKKDSGHNGGCFGIAPSGSIWWIPQGGSTWREMPGNGVARWASRSYIGVVCAPHSTCSGTPRQIISVKTAAGNYFAQDYTPGEGWNGFWRSNTQ